MSEPLTQQYHLHVGKGEWGPTLPHTSAAYALTNMTVAVTNYNYYPSRYLGLGIMFSRGGFITPVSQTGPSEKSLWAVPSYQWKAAKHAPGDSYDDIRLKLDAVPEKNSCTFGQTCTSRPGNTPRHRTVRRRFGHTTATPSISTALPRD